MGFFIFTTQFLLCTKASSGGGFSFQTDVILESHVTHPHSHLKKQHTFVLET